MNSECLFILKQIQMFILAHSCPLAIISNKMRIHGLSTLSYTFCGLQQLVSFFLRWVHFFFCFRSSYDLNYYNFFNFLFSFLFYYFGHSCPLACCGPSVWSTPCSPFASVDSLHVLELPPSVKRFADPKLALNWCGHFNVWHLEQAPPPPVCCHSKVEEGNTY